MNKFTISKYEECHSNLLVEFNERISSSNLSFSDPKKWQFFKSNKSISQDFYVLLEDNICIRGIGAIKNQEYFIKGNIINFQDIQLPISESLVDSNYIFPTIYFLKYLSNLGKNMHALGMGGLGTSLPRILKSNKFNSYLVPFFIFPFSTSVMFSLILFKKFNFKIEPKFLIPFVLFDFCRKYYCKFIYALQKFTFEDITKFSSIDSSLWQRVKGSFDLIAVKDEFNLNQIYTNSPHTLIKKRIYLKDKFLGLVILKITKHDNNKYFLNAKTLTIVDVICAIENYKLIIKAIKKIASYNQCDIILVNSSFDKFNRILLEALFIKLPSNFGFVYKTDEMFNVSNSWITRADGDGPINL